MIEPLRISFEVACPASGWENLGSEGPSWKERNQGGWNGVLPHVITEAERA